MTIKLNFRTLLREPLLHFLLIGAALFLFYNLQNEGRIDNERIVISEAQINHLVTLWKKKRQRPPTQTELESMIQQQVREEVMVREALAMGLDKNDSIIRRRLAQKIEFITSDLATLAEPTETKLANYLEKHSDEFTLPARIDFLQIYFNPEKHEANIQEYINNLLNELSQVGENSDITKLGDPLMLEQQHEQVTEHDVTRLFGKEFASKIFTLPVGSWQGPVQSGYGFHLIILSNKTENKLPELEAVREKVRLEWQAQQRQDMDKVFYESLRQRYEITIER
ncbi:MAG: hypothetical protein DRR06_13345 [Gammaproteobacteria bacterium]|nr:MAG: hypothetical protein DRR06_13345 [Gammaproteobacteria bacterium]